MRTRLFNSDSTLNELGVALDKEIAEALRPILARTAEYDARDVGYIVLTAANEAHLDEMLFGRERK